MISAQSSANFAVVLPPPCVPGTRTTLINKILHWLTNDDTRSSNVLWLYGPLGIGKTAVMATIWEEARKRHVPSVGLRIRAIPDTGDRKSRNIIQTLASILADHDSEYKRLLEEKYASGQVRDNSVHTLFSDLLTPLSLLKREQKTLVLLDGLGTSPARLIETIFTVELPVLWILATQPAPYMKHLLDGRGVALDVQCGGDEESEKDIELILRRGFARCRQEFGIVGEDWPSASEFSKLARKCSRVPVLAETFIKVIQKPALPDPRARLRSLLAELDSGSTNLLLFPYDSHFYHLIGYIASSHLRIAQCVIVVTARSFPLTVSELSMLLAMPPSTIETVVEQMFPVIDVQSSGFPERKPARLTNHSFLDFLLSEKRSGEYAIQKHRIYGMITTACSRIFAEYELPHPLYTTSQRISLHYVLIHAITHIWDYTLEIRDIKSKLRHHDLAGLLNALVNLGGRVPVSPFALFLHWLQHDNPDSVRSIAQYHQDQALIDACRRIAKPMDFTKPLSDLFEDTVLRNYFQDDKAPRYVLIGPSERTILAILVEDGVGIYSANDIGEL